MLWLTDSFEAIRDFMELGGPVLRWIAVTIFLMWVLIVERIMYFRTTMRSMAKQIHDDWESRPERRSWNAHQIRELMISRFSMDTNKGIPTIQTLVALCPLLGLLGTVTGMISVFQVMAASGSGNVRAMAAGVSQATVPTMAGMVGALSGVLLVTLLSRRAAREVGFLEDSLTMDHYQEDTMRKHDFSFGSGDEEENEINLTPMLDVVFIMLIFFIVTASFIKEAGIDVNRPDAPVTETKPEDANILVAITANDAIWIDRRLIDPRAVRANIERLHAENPDGSVVIQANKKSTNKMLVWVMDASRQAGVYSISIADSQS